MRQTIASEFDFEDWAGLYIENPQEFEARRQAALMIEMSRGSSENAAAARALLDAYDKAVKGCSPAQRMKIASDMMMESAHQLSAELQLLQQTLEQVDLAVPGPDSDSVPNPNPNPGQITGSN